MRRLACLAALTLLLAGCSGGAAQGNEAAQGSAAEATQTSLFAAEIAPVLQQKCAICHLTGEEAGRLVLVPDGARASLVDAAAVGAPQLRRVVPGDPDASYLIMKLEGTHLAVGGSGARMPFGGPFLPAESIAKFRRWIAEGATP